MYTGALSVPRNEISMYARSANVSEITSWDLVFLTRHSTSELSCTHLENKFAHSVTLVSVYRDSTVFISVNVSVCNETRCSFSCIGYVCKLLAIIFPHFSVPSSDLFLRTFSSICGER